MELKINYEIEMEDLQNFQNEFLTNIDFVRKSTIKVGVIYGVMLIMFFSIYSKGLIEFENFIFPSLFLIAYYIFYISSIRKRMSNNYKLQLSTMSLKNVIGENEITFFDEEFVVKTDLISTTYQYKSVIKRTETNTHLFLFTSAMSAIVIPKKKVENQILEVENLLNEKIVL
jgi:hypothetical protein